MLAAAFMPELRSGKGSIVMMSWIAGKTGEQGLALYTASKAALIGLTEALALANAAGSEGQSNLPQSD